MNGVELKKQLERIIRESGLDEEVVRIILIEIIRMLTLSHLASLPNKKTPTP